MATTIFNKPVDRTEADAGGFVFRHEDGREWTPDEMHIAKEAFGELGASARRLNNRLEADFAAQPATSEESRATSDRLRDAVADLTVRVAVLEEARNSIDDRVRRVMVEVIADWERQHTARETERLKAELTELKQSRIVSS